MIRFFAQSGHPTPFICASLIDGSGVALVSGCSAKMYYYNLIMTSLLIKYQINSPLHLKNIPVWKVRMANQIFLQSLLFLLWTKVLYGHHVNVKQYLIIWRYAVLSIVSHENVKFILSGVWVTTFRLGYFFKECLTVW